MSQRDPKKRMAALRQKQAMLNDPRTPFGTRVEMMTRGGGLRAGYMNRYNRLVKKSGSQMKGLPGCGPTIRDWL